MLILGESFGIIIRYTQTTYPEYVKGLVDINLTMPYENALRSKEKEKNGYTL